jgi:hypothetical protein
MMDGLLPYVRRRRRQAPSLAVENKTNRAQIERLRQRRGRRTSSRPKLKFGQISWCFMYILRFMQIRMLIFDHFHDLAAAGDR